jgi:retrograde regulation protein 2
MAVMAENLFGIVDMGSNGIRCSITDLANATCRILPTVYQYRAGISLYDAQWQTGSMQPIPEDTIHAVTNILVGFKRTCRDFGVANDRVRIIATEATRVAKNSEIFRSRIQTATGWPVEMLPKEEEGKIGALGVASSFHSIHCIMMDLGGGSTQITWLKAHNGDVEISPAGSVSMPYGAAALARRLNDAETEGGDAVKALRQEIMKNLRDAVDKITIPREFFQEAQSQGGLDLCLSGGGFRGWGYVLMSQHNISPYPIPVINGFKTTVALFQNASMVKAATENNVDLFRVSGRRASQLPAVALLVECLVEALPQIGIVHFAQGGVREGYLFDMLDPGSRRIHPMVAVTRSFSPKSVEHLTALLVNFIPGGSALRTPQIAIKIELILSFVQMMFAHSSLNKEQQAASALRSTTTGLLGSVLGADHEDRATMAIMLCERWGGDGALSPADISFHQQLVALLSPNVSWWAAYLGRAGALLAEAYPAGVVNDSEKLLEVNSSWRGPESDAEGQHGAGIQLAIRHHGSLATESFEKALKQVEKLGKKKSWSANVVGRKIKLSSLIQD